MVRVTHRLESSPDNVGHWQCSVTLVVLLGRVSARLRKEPTDTFGEIDTTPPPISEPPGRLDPGIRGVLDDRRHCIDACGPWHSCQIHGRTNYLVMSRGAAVRCWVCEKSRSLNRNVRVPTREPGKLG
jgi:hypothetical protein